MWVSYQESALAVSSHPPCAAFTARGFDWLNGYVVGVELWTACHIMPISLCAALYIRLHG